MQRIFNIYPHHGYLNTDINISCVTPEKNISILCCHNGNPDGQNDLYSIGSEGKSIRLSAGKHTFTCRLEDGEEQYEEVIIEDAIKLGGGKFVKGCISGKSNWCVIKMTDRLYFHNMSSGEEYYEMSVVPDKMHFLNEQTLLFFSKGSGFSVYSFCSRSIEHEFCFEPLYESNTRIVTKIDEQSVDIIDITNSDYPETILKGSNFVVQQNQAILYYKDDDEIISYDILSYEIKSRVKICGELISILPSGHYITRVLQNTGNWSIHLNSTHDGSLFCILKAEYIITSCLDSIFQDISELKSKFNDFCETLPDNQRQLVFLNYSTIDDCHVIGDTVYYITSNHSISNSTDFPVRLLLNSKNELRTSLTKHTSVKAFEEKLITYNSDCLPEIVTVYQNGTIVKSYNGKLVGNYILTDESPKSLMDSNGRVISRGELTLFIRNRNDDQYLNLLDLNCFICKYGDTNYLYRIGKGSLGPVSIESALYSDGILILFNGDWKNKQYLIVTKERGTIIDDFTRSNLRIISDDLSKVLLFDCQTFKLLNTRNGSQPTPILTSLYDSSSFKEALFAADSNSIIISDNNNQFYYQNLSSGERSEFNPGVFVRHINGYRPLIDIKPRQPRVIDPVSGQLINPAEFLNYVFYSPDGKCHVGSRLENGADSISNIEYRHTVENRILSQQEYNDYAQLNTLSPSNKNARLRLMRMHPSWFVSVAKGIDANSILSYASDIGSIDGATRRKLDYFVNYDTHFTDAFIEANEYIMLYSSYSSSPRKVDLGTPLWFINYVSFSYDGKKMALAGRYPYNTIDKINEKVLSGLFLLYDIEENRIIKKETDTYAVWVTAFNKDGLIAFYDSKPITYILRSKNPDSQTLEINPVNVESLACIDRRNFLCFSPSGKYIAMSSQGYVCMDASIKTGKPWGHQPSTNVYIRGCNNLNKDIAHYNDHGDMISGVAAKQKTVSMVAFSTDDRKLLSVSNDGVIVVRNLHLEQ